MMENRDNSCTNLSDLGSIKAKANQRDCKKTTDHFDYMLIREAQTVIILAFALLYVSLKLIESRFPFSR
jgi:hypothetical protein